MNVFFSFHGAVGPYNRYIFTVCKHIIRNDEILHISITGANLDL